jgi:glyoxylase-like metal-dependent hydrolase (beta-lactamase superfamily II)
MPLGSGRELLWVLARSRPRMRIHHLSCGTMCPVGHRLFGMGELTCHCLLIETARGLVLVDTGFGKADVARPRPRLSRLFTALDRPQFDQMDTAVEQIRALGLNPKDLRHIVLTHLDFDHAGGISDFPQATVHVLAEEAAAARHRHGFIARRRYRPAQWRAAAKWQEYAAGGEPWFGFAAVRQLAGLPPEILMVPLPGHTVGHCGVAVRDSDRWLLHAGDAYFHHGELQQGNPHCPPGLRGYQWLMQTSPRQRLHNRHRLRELAGRTREVTIFCSHDPEELLPWQDAAAERLRPPPRPRDSAA